MDKNGQVGLLSIETIEGISLLSICAYTFPLYRFKNDGELPDFGEIKRVIDKYEEKIKKDLDELEERKLLVAQEEKASKKRIHEEKVMQEEFLRKERDSAMLKVENKAKVVEEEKRDWEIEKTRVKDTKTFERIVTLNVGGSRYTTTLSTLTKYPDSMLGAMFSGRHALVQQEDGSYFIDRDGETFSHVLSYLRDSNIVLALVPTLPRELRMRLEYEARFYQLRELYAILGLMDLRKYHRIRATVTPINSKTSYYNQISMNTLDYEITSPTGKKQSANSRQSYYLDEDIRVEGANVEWHQNTLSMKTVTFIRCNLANVSFKNCHFKEPVTFEGCLMQGTKFQNVGGLVTHKVHFTPWQVSQAEFDPELLEALEAKGCIY